MEAIKDGIETHRDLVRRTARILARSDRTNVVEGLHGLVVATGRHVGYQGAARLLIEAALAVANEQGHGLTVMPQRLFPLVALDVVVAHAHRHEGVSEETRERCVAYLRRIGMTDPSDLEREPDIADTHEEIAMMVLHPLGG
jgi:hypothetical protein